MDIGQEQFITKATQQALQSEHIWPVMAACEAALESGWGKSGLAIAANNMFGMKAHHGTPEEQIIMMNTREWIGTATDGEYVTIVAEFMRYKDWADCFLDRMATLKRLAPTIRNYALALAAEDALSYVHYVSLSWSTDPDRADKVIAIYNEVS
jgi:flagellum-specific peptidoglycan hydrolase FlgJ